MWSLKIFNQDLFRTISCMADHYDVVPENIPTFGPNDPLAGAQWPRIWMDMVKRKLQQKMQDPKANQFMGVLIDLFNQAE